MSTTAEREIRLAGHRFVMTWWEETPGTWRASWRRLPGADDEPVHDAAPHLAAVAGDIEQA